MQHFLSIFSDREFILNERRTCPRAGINSKVWRSIDGRQKRTSPVAFSQFPPASHREISEITDARRRLPNVRGSDGNGPATETQGHSLTFDVLSWISSHPPFANFSAIQSRNSGSCNSFTNPQRPRYHPLLCSLIFTSPTCYLPLFLLQFCCALEYRYLFSRSSNWWYWFDFCFHSCKWWYWLHYLFPFVNAVFVGWENILLYTFVTRVSLILINRDSPSLIVTED